MAPPSHHVGQRVSYDGAVCTVRYVGQVAGTMGSWLGVEWDDATRGKHAGSHKDVRYFSCLSKSPTAASFVRPNRPSDPPRSFIGAMNHKYAPDAVDGNDEEQPAQIVFSGKVAEEVGFDKIRKQLANVKELKIVIVDGMKVLTATNPNDAQISDTCPNVVQLDLSRNLFETFAPVVDICRELKLVKRLGINGNRFRNILEDTSLEGIETVFDGVEELQLDETLLTWPGICHIARNFPALTSLSAGTNQLSLIREIDCQVLSSSLASLKLEYNDFVALSDIGSLSCLTALRNLQLKGNNIRVITAPGSEPPRFPKSLQFLDVSYNNIDSWSFVDLLPTHFPGLTGLRLAHNPVYDAAHSESSGPSTEESHMVTIGRIAKLNSLNFSAIKAADRANAEMFYLSRIAKQLATVPENAEESITKLHPRYSELCEIYGEPDIIRREEVNPSFLEARLISVSFHHTPPTGTAKKSIIRIPKSFDIYAVKGIAGKLFGLSPLQLTLVWETGEWDPVAGYDEAQEDSDEEGEEAPQTAEADGEEDAAVDESGRWVKREVELKDGPKQLGYCVDGLDVTIRIEKREKR